MSLIFIFPTFSHFYMFNIFTWIHMVPLCNALSAVPGQAKVIDGELHLKGLVASPDGQKIFRCERKGKVSGRPRAPGGDGWCQEADRDEHPGF